MGAPSSVLWFDLSGWESESPGHWRSAGSLCELLALRSFCSVSPGGPAAPTAWLPGAREASICDCAPLLLCLAPPLASCWASALSSRALLSPRMSCSRAAASPHSLGLLFQSWPRSRGLAAPHSSSTNSDPELPVWASGLGLQAALASLTFPVLPSASTAHAMVRPECA